jgi:hypothetical protein
LTLSEKESSVLKYKKAAFAGRPLSLKFSAPCSCTKATLAMQSVLQSSKNVKQILAHELAIAQRAADAFHGPGPVAHFQGEARFDYIDPRTGHLEHHFDTRPYCALRTVRRVIATVKGSPHEIH